MHRVAGWLLHGALLALPWLLTREPAAALAMGVWVLGSSESDGRSSEAVPDSEARRALLLLSTLVVSLATALPLDAPLVLVGTGAMVLGLALRRAAVRALGAAFTARIVVGERVVSGPYRWLDHPSELGLLLASLGFVGLCGSGWGLGVWVLAVALPSIQRCGAEDLAWSAAPSR